MLFRSPAGEAVAPLEALDAELAAELAPLGERVGIVALDLSRGVVYELNPDARFITASSIKVPILLTLLDRRERQGRRPSSAERELMAAMIRTSSNEAASALLRAEGGFPAIAAFLRRAKVSGFAVEPTPEHWGYTLTTPRAMATRSEEHTSELQSH